jgi:hypothetical protein
VVLPRKRRTASGDRDIFEDEMVISSFVDIAISILRTSSQLFHKGSPEIVRLFFYKDITLLQTRNVEVWSNVIYVLKRIRIFLCLVTLLMHRLTY